MPLGRMLIVFGVKLQYEDTYYISQTLLISYGLDQLEMFYQ